METLQSIPPNFMTSETTHKELNKTDRSDVEGGGGNSEKIVQDKKNNSDEHSQQVDFYFKLFNLVLRSMDSLLHLMLNATNYFAYNYFRGHF